MQNLFAYYQTVEANFLLAEDYVRKDLEPNLNLDIPEKKLDMAEKEREAIAILNKWKSEKGYEIEDTDDERIDKALENAISTHDINLKKDLTAIKQKMLIEVKLLHKHYCKLLLLLVDFSNLNEGTNFGNNKVIEFLKNNEELNSQILKKEISWGGQKPLLKKINKEVIQNDFEFKAYQSITDTTIEEDRAFLLHIIKEIFFGNEDLLEYLQAEDIFWEENRSILRSMVRKTVKDAESGILLKLSQNWDEDKDFFKKLFNSAVENEEELNKLITEHSKNWNKDRLALTDVIILKLGVTEMLNFPSIPVKVSINEYIEISKVYSTPKSKQFINGLLDKFSSVLQKEGRIKKSGRGLIDNK